MRINVELTQEERDALLYILGAGTMSAAMDGMKDTARAGIRVLNKFFAGSPDFVPYDETSYDRFVRWKPQ